MPGADGAEHAPQTPSRHRMAFLTWAVAYPLITSLLLLLEPLVGGLALPLRTLILTALMVPIMVYWAVPAAIGLSGPGRRPPPR
ncbi:MAG: hypothetical protein AAF526_00815 [Pseudomonadota bacterium]